MHITYRLAAATELGLAVTEHVLHVPWLPLGGETMYQIALLFTLAFLWCEIRDAW